MRQAAGRTALIAVMLGGGLLYAGISQAEDVGAADQAERAAELAAASGGPASPAHLIPFEQSAAAVDPREDDVAPDSDDAPPTAADVAPGAAQITGGSVAAATTAAPQKLASAMRVGHTR